MTTYEGLIADFRPGGPASDEAIRGAAEELGRSLPAEHAQWLRRSNGGEGPVGGDGYLVLLPVEDLVSQTKQYEDFDQFAGLLVIGSNGGGEAFCLDSDGMYVAVPFIGSPGDQIRLGSSVEQFLTSLADGAA